MDEYRLIMEARYTSGQPYDPLPTIVNLLGKEMYWDEDIKPTADDWVVLEWNGRSKKVELPKKLTDVGYGTPDLDLYLQKKAINVSSVEEVRKITDRLPSLTKMLLEDRHNE